MDEVYLEALDELKKIIADAVYTCSTADLWSALRRGFIGVTLHWLDENFERVCVVLVVEETVVHVVVVSTNTSVGVLTLATTGVMEMGPIAAGAGKNPLP